MLFNIITFYTVVYRVLLCFVGTLVAYVNSMCMCTLMAASVNHFHYLDKSYYFAGKQSANYILNYRLGAYLSLTMF